MSEVRDKRVILITGTRVGIGRFLVEHYTRSGAKVIGCSRRPADYELAGYRHFCLDVADESAVKELLSEIRRTYKRLDVLINNAGIASMNHSLLTPMKTVHAVLDTNVVGTFLFCREAAKLMKIHSFGRIVNFSTVATPLKLEGEAIYAASKAAIITLTQVLARELSEFGITVNAVGPTAVKTDLIRNIPDRKIGELIQRQAIHRLGEFRDIANVIDFYLQPESDFITGQVVYLGGVS